jgi:heavy metal sensor kinase
MGITTYRGQLIIMYSLVTFIFMFAVISVLYYIANQQIHSLIDDLLLQTAKEKIAEFKSNPEEYSTNKVIEVFGKDYFKIIKTDTGILLENFEMKKKDPYIQPEFLQEVMQKRRVYKTIQNPAGNLRVLFIPVDEKIIMQLSLSPVTQENLLIMARNLFIGMMPVTLFLSFLIGWIMADKATKPVLKITEEAHAITNKNINGRLDVQYKTIEFSNLSFVFNTILDRIERFVENQKRFTTDVSHEIRSPLTAVKGNVEVTLRRKRGTEEYEETLRNILEEINRLILIVSNLLFLTKADIGAIELNLKEFNIGQLLQRVVSNKKHILSEKNIQIETAWNDHVFYGDELFINQLFSNLLDNAIHYTPNEGIISLNVDKTDNGLNISVKDTGVGIPSNEIEKIFDRFYRVRQNLNMHETGSGLGLYLSRWITEAHGGKITVESELNKGSAFSVYLPYSK